MSGTHEHDASAFTERAAAASAFQPNGCHPQRWALVIPVRHAATAKSRLADVTPLLARAIALDTIVAASLTPSVASIVVVTDDDTLEAALLQLVTPESCSVRVVQQGSVEGLNPSIRLGIQSVIDEEFDGARDTEPLGIGVLLGDLPALRAEDLEVALAAGARHPRAAVSDHETTGTTLVTARPEAIAQLEPLFGADSFARHLQAGFAPIKIDARSTVRADVDTRDDLARAQKLGLRERTSAALESEKSQRLEPNRAL